MNSLAQSGTATRSWLAILGEKLARLWSRANGRSRYRRLRLCESLALGEKRFVAVIEFEGQQFLIGGGTQSVSLLARLRETTEFTEVLTEWCERQR